MKNDARKRAICDAKALARNFAIDIMSPQPHIGVRIMSKLILKLRFTWIRRHEVFIALLLQRGFCKTFHGALLVVGVFLYGLMLSEAFAERTNKNQLPMKEIPVSFSAQEYVVDTPQQLFCGDRLYLFDAREVSLISTANQKREPAFTFPDFIDPRSISCSDDARIISAYSFDFLKLFIFKDGKVSVYANDSPNEFAHFPGYYYRKRVSPDGKTIVFVGRVNYSSGPNLDHELRFLSAKTLPLSWRGQVPIYEDNGRLVGDSRPGSGSSGPSWRPRQNCIV